MGRHIISYHLELSIFNRCCSMLKPILSIHFIRVVLHSIFWDLSHPDPLRTNDSAAWLLGWQRNVTELMQIVKSEIQRNSSNVQWVPSNLTEPSRTNRSYSNGNAQPWFAWRTGNAFGTVQEGQHWNTPRALKLLHVMNDLSRGIADKSGYALVDIARKRVSLRDIMHPSVQHSIQLVEDILTDLREYYRPQISYS